MKKFQVLLAGFSIMLLILWFSKQRASSVDSVGVANEYLLNGKYSEAISLYQRLVEKDNTKDRLAARSGLLRALLITGQYEKLEGLAREYLQVSPSETSLRLFLGKSYFLRGRYNEGQQEFEKALKSSPPTRYEAQLNLGLLHKTLGRLPESRAQFSEVYERIVGEGNSHLGLAAIALQNMEHFHEANNLFKQATRQDPNDLDTWNAWGNLLLEKYNPAVAATVFADALKINPNHPESLLGMALSRYEGQGEQEEEILRKALEVNPNLEGARAALAEVAIESDTFDKAGTEIENLLRINSRSLRAFSLKATLSYAKGQQNELQDQIQQVLHINPLYGEIYEKLANYCVTQRLYKESVEFFRKAIEINPRLWTAYSGLGINLLRLGDEQAAKETLDKAYKYDPFNVWTYNTLRLIDSYKNFDAVRTTNFELKLHKKESKLLQNYVPELLEEAYQTLSSKYKFYPNTPLYFEMFPDHEDFAVRTLGVPGLGALGVCFGRGVVMDSPSARPQGNFNWGSTLWHEFAHVVTLGITNHRVPRWFTEGLSVMEEHKAKPGWGEGLNLETVRAIQEKKLLPVAELNSGFIRPKFPGQVQLSYFQAGQACEFIEKEFGFAMILEMLTLFKSGQSLERTLQQGINLSPQEFDQKFNAYLESLYGKTLRAVDFKTVEEKDLMQDKKKLETLLAGSPDNFFANLKLAGYYRKEGNLEKAITFFKSAKSVFPFYVDSDNPYKQLSEIYKQQGRLNDAITELQALTERHDSDFESMKQLAQWLNEAHRKGEACSVLQKAMYVHPFDLETHELLAEVAFKQKDLDLALREYQAVLALDPSDKATAHFNVAKVLLQMGKKPEAKKEALAALEIAPGFEPAQELLLKAIEVN
jgi:tetratricopeptide (TPR) repeat protein